MTHDQMEGEAVNALKQNGWRITESDRECFSIWFTYFIEITPCRAWQNVTFLYFSFESFDQWCSWGQQVQTSHSNRTSTPITVSSLYVINNFPQKNGSKMENQNTKKNMHVTDNAWLFLVCTVLVNFAIQCVDLYANCPVASIQVEDVYFVNKARGSVQCVLVNDLWAWMVQKEVVDPDSEFQEIETEDLIHT